MLRVQGELLLARAANSNGEAEHCLRHALETARSRAARSWELRAATSLARLWADSGERMKAHQLLAGTYSWFTEGFDTPDLRDAQALIEALE